MAYYKKFENEFKPLLKNLRHVIYQNFDEVSDENQRRQSVYNLNTYVREILLTMLPALGAPCMSINNSDGQCIKIPKAFHNEMLSFDTDSLNKLFTAISAEIRARSGMYCHDMFLHNFKNMENKSRLALPFAKPLDDIKHLFSSESNEHCNALKTISYMGFYFKRPLERVSFMKSKVVNQAPDRVYESEYASEPYNGMSMPVFNSPNKEKASVIAKSNKAMSSSEINIPSLGLSPSSPVSHKLNGSEHDLLSDSRPKRANLLPTIEFQGNLKPVPPIKKSDDSRPINSNLRRRQANLRPIGSSSILRPIASSSLASRPSTPLVFNDNLNSRMRSNLQVIQ